MPSLSEPPAGVLPPSTLEFAESGLNGAPRVPASASSCSAFRLSSYRSSGINPDSREQGCARTTTCPRLAMVSEDHVACLPHDDPAERVASRSVRILVFIMLCQVVQMFMSYDGGATPASLDTLNENMNNSWTAGEFGLLGAMDKIGMTATSIFWGRLLQIGNTKALLATGLFLNAACTAIFGILRMKIPMYAVKFAMGATQSLQGVWATVWTVTMAPPSSKTAWLGLGGVSAGVGNGLGTAVAGIATANGAPYALAFELQAGMLGLLWIFLLCCPQRWLQMHIPEDAELGTTPAAQDSPHDLSLSSPSLVETLPKDSKPGFREQCSAIWKNRVYVWSALAISSTMFVLSGIQFLWVRLFVEVWGLNKIVVTVMLLVVTGVGGVLGIVVGPLRIDRLGGFGNAADVLRSLQELRKFSLIAVLGGIVGIGCLYGKLRGKDAGYVRAWGDHWLWFLFIAVFFICGALNASVPGLCGINMEVVSPRMRTFASGIELTVRNILGYVCGPLIPGVIMDVAASTFKWSPAEKQADKDWQLCLGLGVVLSGNLVVWWLLSRAVGAARVALQESQTAAMGQLQKALQSEDVVLLEAAVQHATGLHMHTTEDGGAVIGMANEAIGAFHQVGKAVVKGSQAFTASREELSVSLVHLEDKVEILEMENEELRRRLAEALQSNSTQQADDRVPLL